MTATDTPYPLKRRPGDAEICELFSALDYLLAQTVDMHLSDGIELTDGEARARARALAIIARING